MIPMRTRYVVGNWKMQGSKQKIAQLLSDIAKGLPRLGVEIVVCPPLVYLDYVRAILTQNEHLHSIALGAQNVYSESNGAFTGEVSPEMLVDLGCKYVIIGHSERRQLFCEEDPLIARKFVASYHAGLVPILCVGETRQEREAGKTFEVVSRQLGAVLEYMDVATLGQGLIAYEPIWAIGTGLTATPDEGEAVHAFIRDFLVRREASVASSLRILYGGSVNNRNAEGLFAKPDIDGALVGGASLVASDFLEICRAGAEQSVARRK